MLETVRRFRNTTIFLSVTALFAAASIMFGRGLVVALAPSLLLLVYITISNFLQEASTVYMHVMVFDEEGGEQMSDVVESIEDYDDLKQLAGFEPPSAPQENEKWFVVRGRKLIVLTPYLCYLRTSKLLGLTPILTFATHSSCVQRQAEHTFVFVPRSDAPQDLAQKVGELTKTVVDLNDRMREMYSAEYTKSLQRLLERYQTQFEEAVLDTVETGQMPFIHEPRRLNVKLVLAAAAASAALLVILLVVV